ncbi:MAG: sulfite exporter TauE/SafE family protein [Oscillospiraceae bacterium]|nr:sulfite exporter TauE/SafE family protein [Oscillospiraceae bacterium]
MISFLIGAASAVTASLGFGSGCVMLICLTLQGVERLTASGINLLFFPCTGAFSLVLHHRRGLVCWRQALPMAVLGCIGALVGSWTAGVFPQQWTSHLFGVLLLVLGLRELLGCLQKNRFLHNSEESGAE